MTGEQHELRATVRRFLAEKAGDSLLWRQMADQLGLQGVALPEKYGGAGAGLTELAIVMEELGRVLLPSPYFATVALAGHALAECGDEAKSRWLPAIVDGSLTATVAFSGADVRACGGELTGTAMFVVDGDTADLLLVVAGADLYAVEGKSVRRTRLQTLDPTRRLGRLELDRTPAVRLDANVDRVRDLAVIALAAEQVGGARACLDAAVGYAKVRVQFGRPIGSFQAIKHKCADLLLEVEAARSAVEHAAATTGDDLPIAAALAAAYCSVVYTRVAKENIQIHGGIGYTWEHDAHRHLKRAKSSELLFGTPATHRARLADLVGI
nr:acyl-CoA dehydrogenase family protein [Fodinicola acaciae]